jgi:aldehyde dehydrogenase (NAD+)
MLTQIPAKEIVASQRRFFYTGTTKDVEFRMRQLKRLQALISENEKAITEALWADLHKSEFESVLTEISYCIEEINYNIKHLRQWTRPKTVSAPLTQQPAKAQLYYEPLGVVLIIGPWNYPFQLTVAPLIGAIAAGNCAIMKPSEVASHTSSLMAKLFNQYFDSEYIKVIEGDKDVTQSLLAEKFDHIFFTGGTAIGKIIMSAAAEQLTPVTLELGAKCPCLVDADTHLEYSARRLIWGKLINAGQSCIAPDYLLVDSRIKDQLIAKIIHCIKEFYGENPATHPDYGRIISDKHFQRLQGLLGAGEIIYGGDTNPEERYIAPTLIEGVTWDDPIMQDEIFGPILPIFTYDDLNDAITHINQLPKPLAVYIFSQNKAFQQKVLQTTSSGGVCINDTVMQLSSPELPFGGVGDSGIGRYHGKSSFITFSNEKSVLKRSFLFDLKLRYAPYEGKLKLLNWIFK